MLSRGRHIPLVALASVLLGCGTGATTAEPIEDPEQAPALDVIGDDDAVKVGVLAIRSAVAANAQYGPIVEHLQDELGRPFELVPLSQEALFDSTASEAVDFVLSNPLSSVQLRRLHGTEFLATLHRPVTGTAFGGLIIVRPDSDIEELADLVDRDVTCVAFQTAAAGCNFQLYHLREAGITSDAFGTFTETPSQDNIVLSVLNGDVDAGFIRTGQLERMVADGTLVSVDELRVIDPQDDEYVHVHTTPLYPEWPFAALESTPSQLVASVADVLLATDPSNPLPETGGGFALVPPSDYGVVDKMIVELQLRSWNVEAN